MAEAAPGRATSQPSRAAVLAGPAHPVLSTTAVRPQRVAFLAWIALRALAGSWRALLPSRRASWRSNLARQVRLAFEAAGPTFVKLGQLVSASPGTFPPALVEELGQLQDAVAPEPWEAVGQTLEDELGSLRARFRWIDWHPLAAASIAQVHPATLSYGAEAVLKVQRSDLGAVLGQDLRVMRAGAGVLARLVPPLAATNPVGVVEDFARTLGEELDFRVEAAHMERLRGILDGWRIRIPRVHWDLTTARVLTMERLEGTKITDTAELLAMDVDRVGLADTVLGSLIYSALRHGIFHADGHAGNLLVQADGTIGLLDFGIVGKLDDRTRVLTAQLVAAFVEQRFDAVAEAIVALARVDHVDMKAAVADLQAIAKDFLGQPWGDVPLARLLVELLRSAHRHGVAVPTGLVLFCKQLLYLDGVGRVLNPGFDVFGDGSRMTQYLPPEAFRT